MGLVRHRLSALEGRLVRGQVDFDFTRLLGASRSPRLDVDTLLVLGSRLLLQTELTLVLVRVRPRRRSHEQGCTEVARRS